MTNLEREALRHRFMRRVAIVCAVVLGVAWAIAQAWRGL
jgi:hypothetical protein